MTLCGVHDNMHVHTTVAHTCDYPLYLYRHRCITLTTLQPFVQSMSISHCTCFVAYSVQPDTSSTLRKWLLRYNYRTYYSDIRDSDIRIDENKNQSWRYNKTKYIIRYVIMWSISMSNYRRIIRSVITTQ